jgi:hypothetical protein
MVTSTTAERKPDYNQIECDLHNARVLVEILWDSIDNDHSGKTRQIVLLDEIDRHLRSIEEEIEPKASDEAEVRQ